MWAQQANPTEKNLKVIELRVADVPGPDFFYVYRAQLLAGGQWVCKGCFLSSPLFLAWSP
jgi:hypothetical protein